MFDHEWLKSVQRAPNSDDVWDVERDGYGDTESGHGTFIAGLILQVAPSASVYAVKVLDSHGVGDDFDVAKAMAQLPSDIDIINLSLGGYTDRDAPPLAISTAMRGDGQPPAVVAAAGNQSANRPFWPAAFEQVLAVGAVERARRQVVARGLQQLRPVGRRHRPRHQPAVDLRPRQDACRPGPDAQPHRPGHRLQRLGGLGRHVVRDADRRRHDRPHDVPQRPRVGPRGPDQAARRPPRRRRSPSSRNAVLLDELEGAPTPPRRSRPSARRRAVRR